LTAESVYPCPECQVGALRGANVSYITHVHGRLVTVPDFPAWVCDVCGRREYDEAALAELRAMLESGAPPRRRPTRPISRPTPPHARPPADPRRRT
jgi:YgiT-type zinc finger domain-containing protein